MNKVIAGIASVCMLLLVACGTTGTTEETTSTPGVTKSTETQTLRVGMSKSQVLAIWGDPSGKQITGHGEIWVWGGQQWLRQIPYAGPFVHVQTSKAMFGPDGRLADFRLTDQGDIMSAAEGMGGSRFSSF